MGRTVSMAYGKSESPWCLALMSCRGGSLEGGIIGWIFCNLHSKGTSGRAKEGAGRRCGHRDKSHQGKLRARRAMMLTWCQGLEIRGRRMKGNEDEDSALWDFLGGWGKPSSTGPWGGAVQDTEPCACCPFQSCGGQQRLQPWEQWLGQVFQCVCGQDGWPLKAEGPQLRKTQWISYLHLRMYGLHRHSLVDHSL